MWCFKLETQFLTFLSFFVLFYPLFVQGKHWTYYNNVLFYRQPQYTHSHLLLTTGARVWSSMSSSRALGEESIDHPISLPTFSKNIDKHIEREICGHTKTSLTIHLVSYFCVIIVYALSPPLSIYDAISWTSNFLCCFMLNIHNIVKTILFHPFLKENNICGIGEDGWHSQIFKLLKKTSSAFSLFLTLLSLCAGAFGRVASSQTRTKHTRQSEKPGLWTLQKFICPSAGDCGFGRRNSLITQKRTEEGQIKKTHKEQNTVVFKWGKKTNEQELTTA